MGKVIKFPLKAPDSGYTHPDLNIYLSEKNIDMDDVIVDIHYIGNPRFIFDLLIAAHHVCPVEDHTLFAIEERINSFYGDNGE